MQLTAGINNYKLSVGDTAQDVVSVSYPLNTTVVASRQSRDHVTMTSSLSLSVAGRHRVNWTYNLSVHERGQRRVKTLRRQLAVSIDSDTGLDWTGTDTSQLRQLRLTPNTHTDCLIIITSVQCPSTN